jgi:hypothetical protein
VDGDDRREGMPVKKAAVTVAVLVGSSANTDGYDTCFKSVVALQRDTNGRLPRSPLIRVHCTRSVTERMWRLSFLDV